MWTVPSGFTSFVRAIASWAGPFTTHTRVQTGQSGGVLVYETRDPVLLVSGKVRHAQGQRLNRFEVKEREKVREQKGRGGNVHPLSFVSNPSFLIKS